MHTRSSAGRAFQTAFPGPLRRKADAEKASRAFRYERLMQVSVANTYYAPPHACPDFTVTPTAASQQLMTNLGLLLLKEPAGFSVLYDANRKSSLVEYLKGRKWLKGQFETRLSFELALDTPTFENFTRVPNDLAPADANFYFSNQNAYSAGRRNRLTLGRFVRADELLPVVPAQFPIAVGKDVERVEVLNLVGDQVLSVPRCVPDELAAAKMPDAPDTKRVCRNTIYLDLSSLPEDVYEIRVVNFPGSPPREETRRKVLYTAPLQYGFINLLFSDPVPQSPTGLGIYPVNGLDGDAPTVSGAHYEIVFERRSTFWRYYVVLPPARRGDVGGLMVETEPLDVVTFAGPTPVVIATSTPAFLFVSTRPVPLSQTPPARFILNSDDGILMKSMPVASIDQILPGRCVYSDIYVYV